MEKTSISNGIVAHHKGDTMQRNTINDNIKLRGDDIYDYKILYNRNYRGDS